jgi:PII-like signaling protein
LTLPRRSERLTIYLEQTGRRGRVPDFVEIVERARTSRLAGATVVQGVEGFGRSGSVHRRHGLGVKADVPVVITIVDTSERIQAFLAEVEDLVPRGLIVRQPVEVVIHRDGAAPSPGASRR